MAITAMGSPEEQDWGNNDEKEISVPEFDLLCTKLKEQRDIAKKMKEETTAQNKLVMALEKKVMAYMEKFGKKRYATDFGLITISEKFTVKVPKDPEAKAQFFEYLEARGVKDDLLSINSATLNSYYKEAMAESGDPLFSMPGIEEGATIKQLKIIKGK